MSWHQHLWEVERSCSVPRGVRGIKGFKLRLIHPNIPIAGHRAPIRALTLAQETFAGCSHYSSGLYTNAQFNLNFR